MSDRKATNKKIEFQRAEIGDRSNLRRLPRIDIRTSEGVEAILYLKSDSHGISARVYDLSIEGVSLVLPHTEVESIPIWGEYKIELTFSWGHRVEAKYQYCWKEEYSEDFVRLGFRSIDPPKALGGPEKKCFYRKGPNPKEFSDSWFLLQKSFLLRKGSCIY